MFKHKLFFVLVLLAVIASACAPAPTAVPPTSVPPTAAPKPAATVAPTAVPPTAAPKPTEAVLPTIIPAVVPKTDAGKAILAKFQDPKQTIEYHSLLDIKGITEKDLAASAQKLVIDPLKPIVALQPLPTKPKPNIYVDSREYAFAKDTLIVRLRNGEITVKSRASNPDVIIDLPFCSSGKYEMDYSNVPFYSMSTTITFPEAEQVMQPPALTFPILWSMIEKKCPALYAKLKPNIENAKGVEFPGISQIYGTTGKITIPNEAEIEEVAFAIWFYPPTDKYLVEYAFTGFVKDRPKIEKLYAQVTDFAKKAGMLNEFQATKTETSFNMWFGTKTPIK